jgi:hypothetical protein
MRILVAFAVLAGCHGKCSAELAEFCTTDCPEYHQQAADCQVTTGYDVQHCAGEDIVTCGTREEGEKYYFLDDVLVGVAEYSTPEEKSCDGRTVYGEIPEECE